MDAAIPYAGGVILGLDAATKTGVCEGEPGETPRLEMVNFGKPLPDHPTAPRGQTDADLFARALIWSAMRMTAVANAPRRIGMVVIEGLVPQYDKTIQCGIWAIFHAVATTRRIPVIVAPIQTWRKAILGDGRLNRVTAKARAINITSKLGWNPQDDNAAEAGCIWLWGCSQVAPQRVQRTEPLFLNARSA